jgi:hypothetical protein
MDIEFQQGGSTPANANNAKKTQKNVKGFFQHLQFELPGKFKFAAKSLLGTC